MKQGDNTVRKVAIVHDFLLYPGGAERVVAAIAEAYPEAPIYTLLYDKEKMRGVFAEREVRTSFLQKFPRWLRKRHRWLLPFYAAAAETFDLRDFDLVISSSGAWSKGVVTKLKTKHIAYIHSPMRFAWDYNERYWKEMKKKPSLLARMFLSYLRVWDAQAADRPDILIANSEYTKRRIEKYYRKEARVVYPPVTMEATNDKQQTTRDASYFLIVSRLTENKRIDLAVRAFNKLNLPLVIAGEGRCENDLRKMAGKSVRIVGWQSEEDAAKLFSGARAFIFPGEDDFGITIAQSLQAGTPVIAYRGGGAREIIEEGVTGEFFGAQTHEVLSDAVRRFLEKEGGYDTEVIRKSGERFSKERFQEEMRSIIEES